MELGDRGRYLVRGGGGEEGLDEGGGDTALEATVIPLIEMGLREGRELRPSASIYVVSSP